MSQAEHPDRQRPDHEVTLDDVRQLMGASTPHFALQLRNRIAKLIRELPAGHPARIEGEREVARLTALGLDGELRGHAAEPGMRTLASVSDDPAAALAEQPPAH
jgi:antitoxin (DNA-binding transcriptional repressor) of toxin-antitoxin stability system